MSGGAAVPEKEAGRSGSLAIVSLRLGHGWLIFARPWSLWRLAVQSPTSLRMISFDPWRSWRRNNLCGSWCPLVAVAVRCRHGVRIGLAHVLAHRSGVYNPHIYMRILPPKIYLKGGHWQGLPFWKIVSIVWGNLCSKMYGIFCSKISSTFLHWFFFFLQHLLMLLSCVDKMILHYIIEKYIAYRLGKVPSIHSLHSTDFTCTFLQLHLLYMTCIIYNMALCYQMYGSFHSPFFGSLNCSSHSHLPN